MVVPSPIQWQGGQMTDLPTYPGGSDPTALFEIVSPGNEEEGRNYAITAQEVAVLIGVSAYDNHIIHSGPYASVAGDTRILVDRTVTTALTITLLPSASYGQPVLVKDIKGDASEAAPITIVFTGIEMMDGQTSVSITNPFGYIWFNPLSAGFYGT